MQSDRQYEKQAGTKRGREVQWLCDKRRKWISQNRWQKHLLWKLYPVMSLRFVDEYLRGLSQLKSTGGCCGGNMSPVFCLQRGKCLKIMQRERDWLAKQLPGGKWAGSFLCRHCCSNSHGEAENSVMRVILLHNELLKWQEWLALTCYTINGSSSKHTLITWPTPNFLDVGTAHLKLLTGKIN